MHRRSFAALFAAALALSSSSARGQASPPPGFKFTPADEKLWNEAEAIDGQFGKRGLLFNDPALDERLEQLAKPILSSVGAPERVRWKLRVLRDPSVNAFGLPNGSIYVHTGLLALLENDAQLTGILAREVAHVTNRDAYLQFRKYRKKMVAREVAGASVLAGSLIPGPNLAWGTGTYAGALIEVVGGISEVTLTTSLFGYSSELERGADIFAVNQLAAVGYDPMELAKAFRVLDERLDVALIPTFYSDHEKLEQRIADTTSVAKGKPSPAATPPALEPPYAAVVAKGVRYNIQADIDGRRFRTAVARAQQLVKLHPDNPNDACLLGDAYRMLGPRTPEPSERDLTARGEAQARRTLKRQTTDEEEKDLLSRPDGPAIRQANQKKAEEWYTKARVLDASCSNAYRGLGLLYEDQGKSTEARAAYRRYLELAPEASDSLRIRRRMDALDKTLK